MTTSSRYQKKIKKIAKLGRLVRREASQPIAYREKLGDAKKIPSPVKLEKGG